MPEITLEPDILPFKPAPIAQGLSIERARDLLDWLEAHGIDGGEIDVDEVGKLAVRLRD